MNRSVRLALLIVVLAAPVSADDTFYASLVPRPNTGSTATGSATLVLNATATTISYTITVSGLTSPEQAAHIHRPDGSIAHQLPLGETKNGFWFNPGFIDVSSLRAGQLFILVHTENNPAGEVRGDITDKQVSAEVSTWGRIKALYE